MSKENDWLLLDYTKPLYLINISLMSSPDKPDKLKPCKSWQGLAIEHMEEGKQSKMVLKRIDLEIMHPLETAGKMEEREEARSIYRLAKVQTGKRSGSS